MDARLLTENGWKTTAAKFKVKDNGLQRALIVYEKIPQDKHAERLKAIGSVMQCAAGLKKAKELLPLREVVDYLTQVFSAAQSEQHEILHAKAAAEKAATVAAKTKAVQEHEDVDEDDQT